MDNYLNTQNEMDDIFSVGNVDEETENKENIKKLLKLDCENSLNISSDIDNVSEIRNSKTLEKGLKNKNYGKRIETPLSRYVNDRNLRKSEEILKYIADNSDYEEKQIIFQKKLQLQRFNFHVEGFEDLKKLDLINQLKDSLSLYEEFAAKIAEIVVNKEKLDESLRLDKRLTFLMDKIRNNIVSEDNKLLSIYHQNFDILNTTFSSFSLKNQCQQVFSFTLESMCQRKNLSCGMIRADNSFIRTSRGKEVVSPILTDENEFKMSSRFKLDDLMPILSEEIVYYAKRTTCDYMQQSSFSLYSQKKKGVFNCSTQTKLLSVQY